MFVACGKCPEKYHMRCVGLKKAEVSEPSEYVCSHCVEGGNAVGHIRDVESLDSDNRLIEKAIGIWTSLFSKPQSQLCDLYKAECGVPRVPTKISKRALVCRVIYARVGVDFRGMPSFPSGINVYAAPPELPSRAGPLTVAQKLYDDVMMLSREIPGLGTQPEPAPTSQKDGLLPHLMAHLYASYQFHMLPGYQDPSLFGARFMGGLDHWNGVHAYPQCRKNPCVRGGFMPGLTADARRQSTDRLRPIMTLILKQYSNGRLTHPMCLVYDTALEVAAADWFVPTLGRFGAS